MDTAAPNRQNDAVVCAVHSYVVAGSHHAVVPLRQLYVFGRDACQGGHRLVVCLPRGATDSVEGELLQLQAVEHSSQGTVARSPGCYSRSGATKLSALQVRRNDRCLSTNDAANDLLALSAI